MLIEEFHRALKESGVQRGRVLVAVSGGLDSCVLLELLREVSAAAELELTIGHVNHQLRGDASESDERFVVERAADAGLPILVRRVDPEQLRVGCSSRVRPTLEEAARTLRRGALVDMADASDARWILTAHHAGDQAETVLLRLLRGTGPEGLAAMAPVSADGRWVRPLLAVDPARLQAYAARNGVEWREDASNENRDFARNRLRHEVLPRLAEGFNPQILRALGNLADAQREDARWIDTLVDSAAKGRIEEGTKLIGMALEGWDALPDALAHRLARRALVAAGLQRHLTRTHLERVVAFLRRGRRAGRDKELELPLGVSLRRGERGFVLGPIQVDEGIDRFDNATVVARD